MKDEKKDYNEVLNPKRRAIDYLNSIYSSIEISEEEKQVF